MATLGHDHLDARRKAPGGLSAGLPTDGAAGGLATSQPDDHHPDGQLDGPDDTGLYELGDDSMCGGRVHFRGDHAVAEAKRLPASHDGHDQDDGTVYEIGPDSSVMGVATAVSAEADGARVSASAVVPAAAPEGARVVADDLGPDLGQDLGQDPDLDADDGTYAVGPDSSVMGLVSPPDEPTAAARVADPGDHATTENLPDLGQDPDLDADDGTYAVGLDSSVMGLVPPPDEPTTSAQAVERAGHEAPEDMPDLGQDPDLGEDIGIHAAMDTGIYEVGPDSSVMGMVGAFEAEPTGGTAAPSPSADTPAASGQSARRSARQPGPPERAPSAPAAQGRAGQSRAAQSQAGQSRAGQGRSGRSRAGQSRAGQSRAGHPRAGQSSAGQSRAGRSRAGTKANGRSAAHPTPGTKSPAEPNARPAQKPKPAPRHDYRELAVEAERAEAAAKAALAAAEEAKARARAAALGETAGMCPVCSHIFVPDTPHCLHCQFDPKAGLISSKDTLKTKVHGEPRVLCQNHRCKHDLSHQGSMKCPSCGRVQQTHQEAVKAAEHTWGTKGAYRRPLIMFAVGFAIVAAYMAIVGGMGLMAIPVILGTYATAAILGTVAFWLCCALFLGFDAPMGLTAVRLSGVFAVTGGLAVALGFLPFFAAPVVAGGVVLIVFIGLLQSELELDLQDAIIMALVFTILQAGLMILATVLSSGW